MRSKWWPGGSLQGGRSSSCATRYADAPATAHARPPAPSRATSLLSPHAQLKEGGDHHIIRLLGVARGLSSDCLCLALEWAPRPSTGLDEVPDADVPFYTRQLLQAVASAHSKGVLHRNINPSSILVDPARRHLALADWSLCAPGWRAPLTSSKRWPAAPGAPYWMAPETLVPCHGPVLLHARHGSAGRAGRAWLRRFPLACRLAASAILPLFGCGRVEGLWGRGAVLGGCGVRRVRSGGLCT